MTCASCSEQLPEGARFCPACGREVASATTEERRIVTVVFADIVGFTGLSEHLDPERMKRLLDGAFNCMIPQIERFGGRVDKVMGDGILALFGAPIAHEDDPDRAVLAALEMHRALADYVHDHPDSDDDVRIRVGVNTGEVVVGTVSGSDDYTAMGDVVNVASRLQSMAQPGGTLVGSSTEALLSPRIARELVDDFDVRGREQSERVWRVIGRSSIPPLPTSQHDRPFVGRTTQRELLASLMSLVDGGRGAVVAVSGEAGSGKTRLVNEALRDFPNRSVAVFAGVCAPYGETNVWAPIANALFRVMGADRNVSSERLHEIVHERGLGLYGFDGDDPRLQRFVEGAMHLFGHPSELDRVPPAQAREILFQVVVEGIRRRSTKSPVVVWLDDLQWADPLLIDLMTRLARSLADRPVLIVTAQRDDAEIDWPPTEDHPITVRMPLDPLSRIESDELVASVFDGAAPARLAAQLYERSGGNPLFLTELAIVARDQPGENTLPDSLRGLIASRLDGLTTTQRAVIDNAAVLGVSGPMFALERFAREMRQDFEASDIDALIDDGLLDVEDGWWQFRSEVVREVAYRTLAKSVRAERHAGTAAVMSDYDLAPIDQVAHHAAAAAELVAEIGRVPGVGPNIAHEAVELLAQSTQRSLDLGAFNQAIRTATRALDLQAGDALLDRRVRLMRAHALLEQRRGDDARCDATMVLEAATVDGNAREEAIARRILGLAAQQAGELDLARAELSRSVELLRDVGDDLELATSLSDRGFVEVFGGSLVDAEEILAEAEMLATAHGDRRRLAWVRQHQAWVAFLSGDTELAEERLTASSGLFDQLGDKSGTGWALGLLAYVRFMERRFAEAEHLATQVRREAAELGERWAPAMMDSLIASIRLWSGRFADAEELSRRALNGFRELNDRFGIVQALVPRMRSLVALGRNQEAERSLEEALSLADAFGDLAFPTMAAAGTAAHLGLGERAVTLGEVAVDRIAAMDADGSEARITLALGQCQVGDAERALGTLLDVGRDQPYLFAVRAVAHEMVGDHGAAIDDADRVLADGGSTYLDRVLALIAAAGAHASRGEADAGRQRLELAREVAADAGDAVALAMVGSATATMLGDAEVDAVDHLGQGWQQVIEGLAGAPAY